MTIKIYNVIGIGLLVGEKIEQNANQIFLKYPGVLLLGQRTQQGPRDLMFEPVPKAFAGRNEMLKRFKLDKNHILFSGKPHDNVIKLYQDYSKDLEKELTGKRIDVVDQSALNRLPKNAKGEPILQ